MTLAIDPATVGTIAVIFAIAAVIFSVIWVVLLGKGVRIGTKWVKLKESKNERKPAELTKADLRTLIAEMDDVKHRLDEIQTTLNEIRDLLRSTI